MDLTGELLRKVRVDILHLSQEEAAERLEVTRTTVERWEHERSKPQPFHRRKIDEVYGDGLRSLGVHLHPDPEQSTAAPVEDIPPEEKEAPIVIEPNMTTALLAPAFLTHLTRNEKCSAIRQVIKEFDAMNTTNKNYQITRREALGTLAQLPAMTLGLMVPGSTVSPKRYGDTVTYCAAALEGCWELLRSGNRDDIRIASQCVSRYLPVLKTIIRDEPQLRKEALDLAAKYALIRTPLALSYRGSAAAMPLAQEALVLSKDTGDISLTLSAYNRLIQVHFFNKQYITGLTIAQEAKYILTQYEKDTSNPPLHPNIRGGIYSKLALMQAKNHLSPDLALGKATDIDMGDESHHALIDFSQSALSIEVGLTYCYWGDQKKAMEWLEKRIDPETLQPKIPQTSRGRVQTINAMTLSSLKMRDMDKSIFLWKIAINEAKALKNEQRFYEALANFEAMEWAFPGEREVLTLYPLTAHWDTPEQM